MPVYNDLGFYYSSHLTTPSYYSSPFLGTSSRSSGSSLALGLLPIPRLLPSRVTPGYTQLLPSISEAGYGAARRGLPATIDRSASPRAAPRYVAPKPLHIDTSDIDVSSSRFAPRERRDWSDAAMASATVAVAAPGDEPSRQATIKRGRTVVRLHTKKLKENPAMETRRRMTPGEKLVQKFLILDKAEEEAKAARRKRLEELEERERVQAEVTRLQAMAAKKAAADAETDTTAVDGTFAAEPGTPPPTQHFPTIQGLTENAALDILLSAAEEDDEQLQGGEISRTSNTGTVKKRKTKDRDGTIKAAKKKTKKKDTFKETTPDDSPATGDEMVEKSKLQRRNTIRFRRNSSDVEGFPEIESIPGSRRSSFDLSPFDQSPSSRRSSMDSTGDEIPLASEKKSTVKRRKGPKHKFIADVSIENSPSTEPRSPKFVVDEVKVEHSPASPRGPPKKFRYEVIVEDAEEENAASRRGKSGKENKDDIGDKKKKAAASKPLVDRQVKAALKGKDDPKVKKDVKEVKETTSKSFQKSRPESAETKSLVANSKTEENTGKTIQQRTKGKILEDLTHASVTSEANKETKSETGDENFFHRTEVEVQDMKQVKKENEKQILLKDKKLLKDSEVSKPAMKENQKGFGPLAKSKTLLNSVDSKENELKLGKKALEKAKMAKHQADPIPSPPTDTPGTAIQKSDSGINFWDYLNGLEEEKEFKKPFFRKEEPLMRNEEVEKPKVTKINPALHLNLSNTFSPEDKISDLTDSKSSTLAMKVNEKPKMKLEDEKKTKFPVVGGNFIKDKSDTIINKKQNASKVEPQSAPPELTMVTSANSALTAKTPDDKMPKWKAKDTAKTSQISCIDSHSEKVENEAKKKIDSTTTTTKLGEIPIQKGKEVDITVKDKMTENKNLSTTIVSESRKVDEVITKHDPGKEALKSVVSSVQKTPETVNKKPAPKLKGFGKNLPFPASSLEVVESQKTPAVQQSKIPEMEVISKIAQTLPEKVRESHSVPATPGDSTDGIKSPAINNTQNTETSLFNQWKDDVEDFTKNNLQKKDETTASKVNVPEDNFKPMTKWKVKDQPGKDTEEKKTPLWKMKQSSSDKSLDSTTFGKSPLPEKRKILSEPSTPAGEDGKSLRSALKTPPTANDVENIKSECRTLVEIEKPPKKPLVKNKIATKPTEMPTEEIVISNEGQTEKNKVENLVSLKNEKEAKKDVCEIESKKGENILKNKDEVSLIKPKSAEQKNKEENDMRSPFGKKVKAPDDKFDKNIVAQVTEAKKVIDLKTQTSKDEENNQSLGSKLVEQKAQTSTEEKNEPKFPLKKGVKLGNKNKDGEKSEPTSLVTKLKPLAQNSKDENEPSSPVKKAGGLTLQKSNDSEDGKDSALPVAKTGLKLVAQKGEEKEKSEPKLPLKKGANLITQKNKEDNSQPVPSPTEKKVGKLFVQKSKEAVTEPSSAGKMDSKLVIQKSKEDTNEPSSPTKKTAKLVTQKNKEVVTEPSSPMKKDDKLVTQKSKEDTSEPSSPVKKTAKLVTQKNKEDVTEPPSPVKKDAKLFTQKSKEDTSEPSSPTKKTAKLVTQKSKEDTSEPSSPVKKTAKLVTQKNKEDVTEPSSPVKKDAKLFTQKSKEDTTEPSSPVKKTAKLVTQKNKEDVTEPSSPVKKDAKLVTQKNKEVVTEPSSPVKKDAKLFTQKSKEDTSEPSSPVKKTAKLIAPKSKEDEKKGIPTPTKKRVLPVTQKQDSRGAKPASASPASSRSPSPPSRQTTPTSSATAESGSDADSEDSSSEDEGDTTPRASSSSCSSSDSGFDSRPSSVPVPSTAGEASSRDHGSPSPALACSPSLDPYSEDAGLLSRGFASGRTTPPATSLPRFRKYTVDDFQFLKLLGKGSFGKVLLAELRGTDRYYAVKCLKKDVVLEDDDVECTLIERKVLALGTKHPYLCHLFCTFQTESHLLFVMEYLNGGDLMFHIQQSGRFPEARARFYAAEIVCGLKFLHQKGIIYRDLKLDNILLDYEGHVRIADFGMCKLQIFLDRTADTFCGTPDYMAPEIIKGLKYNQCVDWWSFGVLVFEMLVGVSPFSGCDEDELFWSICNEQPQYPRFLSREAHSLLSSLLEKDALKRLGTPSSPKGDVPNHVFFRSIDWDSLERQELEPPFRPRLKHPLDVQYFDAAFTAERAELTPVDSSILQSMDQAQFQGFSYTNPNATD